MRIPIENGAPAAGDAARKGRLVVKRPEKITFAEMRSSGVRGLLVYCADYRCSHHVAISGDQWDDDVRLSDLEPTLGPISAETTSRSRIDVPPAALAAVMLQFPKLCVAGPLGIREGIKR